MTRIIAIDSRRPRALAALLAAAAAVGAGMTLPALADEAAAHAPTTGSHIDPKARADMLAPIVVLGGATEAAKAVPLDASEARAADRPQIDEIDSAQWLSAASGETTASK